MNQTDDGGRTTAVSGQAPALSGVRMSNAVEGSAVIVANGELTRNARLQELWRRAGVRIAADGGARNARLYLELAPHVIIGDMDSLDEETRVWLESNPVEFLRHPPAKDETDLELALLLAQTRGADSITILGAYGGRVDQFVANVLLLTREKNVRITDAASEMWVSDSQATVEGSVGDIVSLIPLDERVEGIVTENLQYPLRAETLTLGSTRGISNVMLKDRAYVHWTKGKLLIVHLYSEI